MQSEFWHKRWQNQEIGFHQMEANRLLREHFASVAKPDATVFVPLCGKSNCLLWLLEKGYRVFGIELSELAVEQFFEENRLQPAIARHTHFTKYSVNQLTIWVGDFFKLRAADLANVDAWYDRAAMIALPPAMRSDYTKQLCRQLPAHTEGLLITLQYPPGYRQGPPFSVTEEEVKKVYGQRFRIEQLARQQGSINALESCDNPVIEQAFKLAKP
ncbi:thiopurine S-methyltransferase [Idiomarina seosinensis]|uniref:thiopurine S-methyltransferase n=1 Tax=Idiomarina seosinensis TaxID=281739 RepID=UPI00384F0A7E